MHRWSRWGRGYRWSTNRWGRPSPWGWWWSSGRFRGWRLSFRLWRRWFSFFNRRWRPICWSGFFRNNDFFRSSRPWAWSWWARWWAENKRSQLDSKEKHVCQTPAPPPPDKTQSNRLCIKNEMWLLYPYLELRRRLKIFFSCGETVAKKKIT